MKKSPIRANKIKWLIGVFLLCFSIFFIFNNRQEQKKIYASDYQVMDSEGHEVTSSYELRRAKETFFISGGKQGDTYQWTSMNQDILEVNAATAQTSTVEVLVKKNGTAALNVVINHADPQEDPTQITVSVNVVFSVNEYLDFTNPKVGINYVNEDDKRRSLVMDYGEILYFGESAKTEPNKLNLIFGSAKDTNAVWTSSNSDVIRINSTASEPMIKAVGAGHARLAVVYKEGMEEYRDEIDVYVRPQLTNADGKIIGTDSHTPESEVTERGNITMENGDKIFVSALFNNTREGILDKITWVIAKRGTENTLVRDSLGNKGPDAEDANLIFSSSDGAFRLDAKAGKYIIRFYVKGTYTNFESSQQTGTFYGCEAVAFNLDVKNRFEDKNITIGIDGSYSLPDAFNISLDILKNNFNVEKGDDFDKYLQWNPGKMTFVGIEQGSSSMKLTCKSGSTGVVPGVSEGDSVTIKITVTDTFSMNIANTTIAVGEELNLSGITGSGSYSDMDDYVWETTDTSGTYISLEGNGPYAVVKGKKATLTDQPILVKLSWTNEEGITRVATSRIFVNNSATNIVLDKTEIEMATETITYLDSGLSGDQNLTWVSSDPSLVSVEPQKGNTSAKLTAYKNTGSTIVTVLNKDNNAYAVCKVTVTAAITSIKIDKGENYETTLSAGYVFLKAIYEPKNATNNELKWTTSDPKTATVDENGMVTLLKEGTVWITVQPTRIPQGTNVPTATCCINIKKNPVTDIKTDVSEIDMIAGDTYTVKTTIVPEDATDQTLKWASDNIKVAKVEGGIITAVAYGDANITVANGEVFKIIKVHVRNRLISVNFTQKVLDIKEGDSVSLVDTDYQKGIVQFNPSDHVNKNLTWTSTDDTVVSVDQNGKITGLKAGGTAWVTCIPEDLGLAGAVSCQINVVEKSISAKSFTLHPERENMYVGETMQIIPEFDPVTTTNKDLIWSSTDTKLATVDQNGMVTALARGDVVIMAVYKDPITGKVLDPVSIKLHILEHVTEITLPEPEKQIYVGDTFAVNPTVLPETADNRDVTYFSRNEAIITVDNDGNVTAISSGITEIVCTTVDGGLQAICHVTVLDPTVPVTGLTLTPTEQNVYVTGNFTLHPTVYPENATDQTVTYQSSDPSVATVDGSGVVTGVASGSAVIICRTLDGGFVATCKVTVTSPLSFSLIPTYRELAIGKSIKIKKVIMPETYAGVEVAWSSSDPSIATVNAQGKVTAVKKGKCKITAIIPAYNISAVCEIKVAKLKTTVSISPKNIRIGKGETYKIKPSVWTNNSTDPALKWKSSKKKIASVNKNGKVTAKKVGYTVITVTTKDKLKISAKCYVRVIKRAGKLRIEPNYATCYIGGTRTLTAKITPKNATIHSIKWKSSDPTIAKVVDGVVRGIAEGTVKITAYTKDGSNKKANCTVKVIEEVPATSIVIAQSAMTMKRGDFAKLSYTVLPTNTSDDIKFASDNNRIAKVMTDGTVKAVGTGTCTITILCSGGVSSTVTINVVEMNRSSVSMRQFDTETLSVNGTSDTVSWYSSNTRVATVDSSGKVTGMSKGSTYIYAYVNGCKVACRVTISGL